MLGFMMRRREAGLRLDWTVVVACLVLAIGVAVVITGVLSGVTGDERAALPDAVESVTPVPEATQALSQSSVFVDLRPEHYGILTIDGVEIETVNLADVTRAAPSPGDQVELPKTAIYEPGNATITFTPTDGAAIEEFATGRHTVKLTYWSLIEGRSTARSYTWTFDVV